MNESDKLLYKYFNNKKVLEVGANRGDITDQLLNLKPKLLTVNENCNEMCLELKKRFNGNITIDNSSILNKKRPNLNSFDVILLKEMVNALPFEVYSLLFENCLNMLNKEERGEGGRFDYS